MSITSWNASIVTARWFWLPPKMMRRLRSKSATTGFWTAVSTAGSVLPAARGERLASRLIEVQEARVRALGYDRIYVKTRNRFVGMRITLARCGYEIVGFELPANALGNKTAAEGELIHCKSLDK